MGHYRTIPWGLATPACRETAAARSSRRQLTFPYNRGKYGLIFYCLKLKNLIVRDTLFVKRIPFYKFVDLSPRSCAGDNDPAGSRDPGTGDEELAGLIRLIEEVSVRLSNTFDFLNGNLVIVENEKHGKYDRAGSDFTHDFSHQKRIRSPAQPKPNFTLPMQITLEIDDTTASLLATLSESSSVTSVVETLIEHAAQGVTALAPGSANGPPRSLGMTSSTNSNLAILFGRTGEIANYFQKPRTHS